MRIICSSILQHIIVNHYTETFLPGNPYHACPDDFFDNLRPTELIATNVVQIHLVSRCHDYEQLVKWACADGFSIKL